MRQVALAALIVFLAESSGRARATGWCLTASTGLYYNAGGSFAGCNFVGLFGVRPAGSHSCCGSFGNWPPDLKRRLFTIGTCDNGCYQGLSYWDAARTIWVR